MQGRMQRSELAAGEVLCFVAAGSSGSHTVRWISSGSRVVRWTKCGSRARRCSGADVDKSWVPPASRNSKC